jgi:ribosomal protein S18 acetylase RimI-like enzyme
VQALDGALPEPALPPGATVRPVDVGDPAELAARAELHREVWEPSKFTADGYARLRERPVYRPDLDLVAVTPAGALAAYTIVWWDPETRTGLFEPVGAAVAHRRQGYAKALLLDALRRLRELGARHAIVLSSSTEETFEPSRRLYASAGFAVANRCERWERDPAPAEARGEGT